MAISREIAIIDNVDRFTLVCGSSSTSLAECSLSPVEACDLVSYLALQTNYISMKQFKAHKSLQAYNQFANGWMKDVHIWSIAGRFVITGRVSMIKILNELRQ